MKTAGYILKDRRTQKGLSIDDVEKATKIRAKFIRAIEADAFGELPSLSYAKGFIKNYSEYLGLNSTTVLAFFRRQTQDASKSSFVPTGMAHPLNAPTFRLTPTRFIVMVVAVGVGLFLLYLVLQYRALQQPPFLEIESPTHTSITTSKTVDILGRTDPDATIAINGVTILVRSDGKFFDKVQLQNGVNTITVTATSRFGKQTVETLEVGVQAVE